MHRPTDLPGALRDLSKNADLLWGIADRTVYNRKTAKQFIVFSFSNQIPLPGVSASWVKAGALFGLERDYEDSGAQCGELSISVLRGKLVDRLGFSTPRRLLYSVNLKTAPHMGIHIKDDVIQNAAYAFEQVARDALRPAIQVHCTDRHGNAADVHRRRDLCRARGGSERLRVAVATRSRAISIRLRERGMDDYVSKPFSTEPLVEVILRWTG